MGAGWWKGSVAKPDDQYSTPECTVKKEKTGRQLPCDWPPRALQLWRTHTLRNQNFKLYKLRNPPPLPTSLENYSRLQSKGEDELGLCLMMSLRWQYKLGRNSCKHRVGISKDNCPDSRCIAALPQAAGMLGKTVPQIPKSWGLCPVRDRLSRPSLSFCCNS